MAKKKRSSIERTRYYVAIGFRLLLIGAIGFTLFRADWTSLALASLTLFLTFVPNMLVKGTGVTFPNAFEIAAMFFIFAAMFLGELFEFYDLVWWWDLMLHATFGAVIGLVGFSFVHNLSKEKIINRRSYFVFFAASFAIAIGTLWEIFEFAMDSLFGLNMLKSGLNDTMWDLIVESAAALIVAFAAYYYLRRQKDED